MEQLGFLKRVSPNNSSLDLKWEKFVFNLRSIYEQVSFLALRWLEGNKTQRQQTCHNSDTKRQQTQYPSQRHCDRNPVPGCWSYAPSPPPPPAPAIVAGPTAHMSGGSHHTVSASSPEQVRSTAQVSGVRARARARRCVPTAIVLPEPIITRPVPTYEYLCTGEHGSFEWVPRGEAGGGERLSTVRPPSPDCSYCRHQRQQLQLRWTDDTSCCELMTPAAVAASCWGH